MKNKTFARLISDLTTFTDRKVILYVEQENDPFVNKYLNKEFTRINRMFRRNGYEFVYLPRLLNDPRILEGLGYYLPYFQPDQHPHLVQEFYMTVINSYQLKIERGSMIRFSEDGKMVEFTYTIKERLDHPDVLFEPAALYEKSISSDKNIPYRVFSDEAPDNRFKEIESQLLNINEAYVGHQSSDNHELMRLSRDIIEKIQRLESIGGLPFLLELLQNQFQLKPVVSRLRIDKEYRIWLDDYGKEIHLEPLPKIVYLLYLKHPEGLNFNELIDYRLELIHLYKNISQRENIDDMIQNINRLVNPLDNSINEKVSRIRLKFISELDVKLAEPYLIVGQRGRKRSIGIDRALVTFE